MVKAATGYNNFSRGKIDHDMMGRYDLPIYNTGADLFENFISNFKGNAIYRAGFESMVQFQDCVLIEYKFNNAQNYICVFYANKIRFLSYDGGGNFGWVLDGSLSILEVATPYTLAECAELDFSQNADTMVFTHVKYPPRKLVRVSANSFTFNTYVITNDPFVLGPQKTIANVTQANPGVATVNGHGYTTGQPIKFTVTAGMVQLNGNTYTATVIDANNFSIGVDTTAFANFNPNGVGYTQQVFANEYPACCLFYKGRLYYAGTIKRPTTVFGSVSGRYDDFTTTPIDDSSALVFTLSDISQMIDWLFGGDNSLIAGAADGIVPINGGGVGNPITAATVDANISAADFPGTPYPLRKDGLVFYAGRDKRNLYSFSYDLLSESFKSSDANFISYDITEGGIDKIRYKKDKNDLIFGICNGSLLSLNFKQEENVVGWHEHSTAGSFEDIAVITDNTGRPQLFALVQRNGAFFIERQAEYVEFAKRVKFFTGRNPAAKKADAIAYKRMVAEQLKQCNYLDNSQTLSNLKTNLITFNGANLITAADNVFAPGDVGKSIVYKTMTGYESGRFKIIAYIDAKNVTVQVTQEPTSNVYVDWYLTFSIVSGLTQYNGMTVSVVSDGGYLADFLVTGGTINLNKQVTHIVIGYKYKGHIKTFCLGFQIQAENTQVTMKAISQVDVRCVSSAGILVGSSPYELEKLQELQGGDLNYLPPIPIDGTKSVPYTDDHEQDKFLHIIQEEPLPANVTAVVLYTDYAISIAGG